MIEEDCRHLKRFMQMISGPGADALTCPPNDGTLGRLGS